MKIQGVLSEAQFMTNRSQGNQFLPGSENQGQGQFMRIIQTPVHTPFGSPPLGPPKYHSQPKDHYLLYQ